MEPTYLMSITHYVSSPPAIEKQISHGHAKKNLDSSGFVLRYNWLRVSLHIVYKLLEGKKKSYTDPRR